MRAAGLILAGLAACATPQQRESTGSALVVVGLTQLGTAAVAAVPTAVACTSQEGLDCGPQAGLLAGLAAVGTVVAVAGANLSANAAEALTVEECRLFCELGTAEQCAVIRERCAQYGFIPLSDGRMTDPSSFEEPQR